MKNTFGGSRIYRQWPCSESIYLPAFFGWWWRLNRCLQRTGWKGRNTGVCRWESEILARMKSKFLSTVARFMDRNSPKITVVNSQDKGNLWQRENKSRTRVTPIRMITEYSTILLKGLSKRDEFHDFGKITWSVLFPMI
jgi:hypothetical protein